MKRFLLAAVLLCLSLGGAFAGDRIWSAVLLATRETPPPPVPAKLADFEGTLKKVFGYNSFYLLGEKTKDIQSGATEWLVPSKRIFMKTSILESSTTGYRMRIELYNNKELLVTTEAKLARDAPLYIRGPQWGRGQIVAILKVR
ncbi:MAG: hypothetical protein WEB60_09755 [Terrimicrobiaceae bacterium]